MNESNRALLFKKIAAAAGEIGSVEKRGVNAFHKYEYMTVEDIMDAVRPILVRHGLALIPSVNNYSRAPMESKGGPLTTVEIEFTLACGESGESISGIVVGEGQDPGDKGFYKAYSGALKYFLKMTFLISSGDQDDPEFDGEHPQQNKCRRCGKAARAGKMFCSEECYKAA